MRDTSAAEESRLALHGIVICRVEQVNPKSPLRTAEFFSTGLDEVVCRVGNSSCTEFGCFGRRSVTWPRSPAMRVIGGTLLERDQSGHPPRDTSPVRNAGP